MGKFLVNFIFWLQAFFSPVLIMGLIGFFINSGKMMIILLSIGVLAGIIVAEYIRRKIGLDSFFGRIYGPNDWDERVKKKRSKD